MKISTLLSVAIVLLIPSTLLGTTLTWCPLYEPGCGGDITALGVNPNNTNNVLIGGDILGIGASLDGGNSWKTTSGTKGYEIAEFTFGPSTQSTTVWAATMDGPYLSTNSGISWTSLRSGMPADGGFLNFSAPIQKILMDPSNPAHLLAFGGNHRGYNTQSCTNFGAIWETTNTGQSWTLKTYVVAGQTTNSTNITSATCGGSSFSTMYVSIPGYGVYKSTDGDGATWTAVNTGLPNNNVDKLVASPTSASTAWVSFNDGNGVYKTTNGGANWTAVNTGLSTSGDYSSLAVSKSNPSVLYTANYNNNALYQSTNGGSSWNQLTNVPANAYNFGFQSSYLCIDTTNANNVYFGTWVTLYHTTNGGSSWVDATSYTPGSNTSLWRGRGYSGLVSRAFKWNPFNTKQSFVSAMDSGKLWQSSDNQVSWLMQSGLNEFGGGNDVSFGADGQTMYGAFGQYGWFLSEGVAKSTNGGANWSYCSNPAGGNAIAYAVYCLPSAPSNVWAVFQDNQLYYSSNSGGAWTKIVTNDPEIDSIAAPTTNGSNASTAVLYIGGRYNVYQVVGSTVTVVGSGGPFTQNYGHMQVRMDPVNQSQVYACNWEYDIYNSGVWRFNPTSGWTKIRGDVSAYDVAIDPTNTNRIVYVSNVNPTNDVGGETGVWMSEDGGSSWTQNNTGLGQLRAQCVTFKPTGGQVVVGCNGGGYFTSYVGTPNPYHVYNFSGNSGNDSVGIANGVLQNSATISANALQVSGGVNQGLALNGSGVANSAIAGINGSFTIQMQATRNSDSLNYPLYFGLGASTSSYVVCHPHRGGEGGPATVEFAGPNGGAMLSLSSGSIPTGTSHTITVTYSASNYVVTAYLDGNPTATATLAGPFNLSTISGSATGGIGGFDAYNDPSFNGNCQYFAIYNTALSASQIQNGQILAHAYNFNGNSGNDIVGASNGALTGGASISSNNLQTSGSANQGLALNGPGVSSSAVASINGSFTIEMRANRSIDSLNFPLMFGFGSSTSSFLLCHPHRGGEGGTATVEFSSPSGGATLNLSSGSLSTGAQQNVIVTYNASNNVATTFLNGTQTASATLPVSFSLGAIAGTTVGGIGGYDAYNDPAFVGSTQYFGIFNEALSVSQVQEEYALQHAYDFSANNGNDSIGVANGVLQNSATIANSSLVTTGPANQGLALNGPGVSTSALANVTGSFTVEIWSTLQSDGSNFPVLFGFGTSTANFLLCHPHRGGQGGAATIELSGPGVSTTLNLSSGSLPTGTQNMVAVTYNASTNTVTSFLNGSQTATATLSSAFNLSSIAGTTVGGIGGFDAYNDPSANGTVQYFAIFNHALTSAQIQADYNGTGNER